MRRIIIEGAKDLMVEKLEEAIEEVREGNPGYVVAEHSSVEVEFSPSDPSEDPSGDWSKLQADFQEVPD